jgi:hypothetical protein
VKRSSSSGRVCGRFGRFGCPTPEEIKRMGLKEDVGEKILKASEIMDGLSGRDQEDRIEGRCGGKGFENFVGAQRGVKEKLGETS